MSGDTAAKRSRGVRILGGGFAIVFVLLAIAAGLAYTAWHAKPTHFTDQQARIAALKTYKKQAGQADE
ncbi:MAG: hypothetical protein ACPGYV_09430 [Phycisphaeraceae bacterium]